ncbi:MAG: hypothetical protein DWQ19_08880 [Crenarchaeota archaeon]|nr:MAG: hypothetical protein DWQ19_08880 [Thermoproteota archaeon]
MNTVAVNIGGTMVQVPSFCGIPVLGHKGFNDLGCVGFIRTNWEGEAIQVITRLCLPGKRPILELAYKKYPDWFEPMDKGAFPIYGFVGNLGQVKFGIVLCQGSPGVKNPLERHKHFYVKECKSVNGFNHYED